MSQPSQPESPHTHNAPITQEWLHDNKLFVITVNDVSREAVDAFVKAIETVRQAWSRDKPFLAVYDVSKENVAFTPYARMRLNEMAKNTPDDLYGAYAIVLTGNIMAVLVSFYIKMSRKKTSAFEYQFFTDREQAIAWVTQKMHADKWDKKPIPPDTSS